MDGLHIFMQFVMHHWELWAVLIIILALIIQQELNTQVKGVHLLSPSQIVFALNQQKAVLIDIRDAEEYAKGHIAGAINAPKHQYPNFAEHANKLVKDKTIPVLLHGKADQQAISVGAGLRKHGFEYVGVLKGGSHGWLAANMLLVKN